MCIRFVHNGDDLITGFNFDIDLAVRSHKAIAEKDRFFIGILRPDGVYHSYHGVHKNGNAGTLLYVHGNAAGSGENSPGSPVIPELTEPVYSRAEHPGGYPPAFDKPKGGLCAGRNHAGHAFRQRRTDADY